MFHKLYARRKSFYFVFMTSGFLSFTSLNKFSRSKLKRVFPNFKILSENLTSFGKKHDFRQKFNIMTACLQEARVIPSKYNGVAIVEITHIYSE